MSTNIDRINVVGFGEIKKSSVFIDNEEDKGDQKETSEFQAIRPEKIIKELKIADHEPPTTKHRKVFYEIEKALEHFNIIILLGLRKAGKTTILKQMRDKYNGYYVDFKDPKTSKADYITALSQDKQLVLFDEIGYLNNFDEILSSLDISIKGTGKQVIITGSCYGALKQLSLGYLGGGRSQPIELFPLSFEEYLFFSNKIRDYGQEYIPTVNDVQDFYKLVDVPDGMNFIINKEYLTSMFRDIEVTTENYSCDQKDILISSGQVEAVLDIIAYTLNYNVRYKRFGATDVGWQEYSVKETQDNILSDTIIAKANIKANMVHHLNHRVNNMEPYQVARIIRFLLHTGFLFVDLIQDENGCQTTEELNDELYAINSRYELESILKRYTLSAISPLLYTRLLIDMEYIVGYPQTNSHLMGQLLELTIKSEDIYNHGFHITHFSTKVRYKGNEVDLISKGVLLESAKGDKSLHNLFKISPEIKPIRILTTSYDATKEPIETDNGYYRIQYPTALFLLSNKSIYNLPVLTVENSPI